MKVEKKTRNGGGTKVYSCNAPACTVQARRAERGLPDVGRTILPGMEYLTWKPRMGGRRFRHAECGYPRPSELTTSDKLSQLYAATEAAEDSISAWAPGEDDNDPSELQDVLRTCAEEVRAVGEGYRESAQNIEDGFGHRTYQCDELEGKADELDGFADSLEQAADGMEEFDADTARPEAEQAVAQELLGVAHIEHSEIMEQLEAADIDTGDPYTTAVDAKLAEAREEWAERVRQEAQDALGECPM